MRNRARPAGIVLGLAALLIPSMATIPAQAVTPSHQIMTAGAMAAAPVPTKLSIKASATTIAYLGTVTLTGVLARSDTGAVLAGKTLSVYGQSLAATAWTKIATVTRNSKGAYTYSRKQSVGNRYRISHTATATTKAVTSSVVTVNVTSPLTSSTIAPAAATAGLVGDVRTWKGSTSSSLNGSKVVVQQLKGTTWATIAGIAVAGGKFSIPFRTTVAGTVQYRLLLPAVKNRFVTNTSPVAKIVVRAMTITTATLPSGTVGTAYSAKLAVGNGRAPVTYSWSGTAPPGLSLSSAGAISGVPTTAGSYKPTVKATDANKQVASKAFSVVVAAPAHPVIADTALPAAQTGIGYAYQVRTTGGTKPFTWSVTSGGLPAGLTLNPGTGLISGIPSTAGAAAVTLTVTSAAGSSSKPFTLTVSAARNWNQPESDAGGSGHLPGENTITAGNIAQLRAEWKLAGTEASAVVDGVLYWSGTLPGSSRLKGVAAYDLATGALLWTAPVVGDQHGTPGTCDELAVTATSVLCNTGGSIVALQRFGNHAVAWDTRNTDPGFTPVKMVVAGERVVVATTNGNAGQVTVYALADGQRQWQRAAGTGRAWDIAVAGDRVFVADGTETLRSFVLSTAAVGWVGTGSGVRQVIATGAWVFSVEFPNADGQSSYLVRRNASDGAIGWSFASPYWIFGNAAADASRVYLPTADFDGSGNATHMGVMAVSVTTGTRSWFAATAYPILSGMAVQDGIVWVHASELGRYRMPSEVRAVNAATGALLRHLPVADTSWTAPVVANGRLLIRHAYTVEVMGLAPPAPAVPAKTLRVGWTGSAYSAQLSASGGTAPYSWSVVSGSLPAGLTLSAAGTITGTPTTPGHTAVTVRVTDAAGRTADGVARPVVRTAGVQSWASAGGDTGRTSMAVSERSLTVAGAALFGQRWVTPAVTATSGQPPGQQGDEPAVADGRLFTIGQDGQLRAFDTAAASGSAALWTVSAPSGRFVGTPTVSGGVVYVLMTGPGSLPTRRPTGRG